MTKLITATSGLDYDYGCETVLKMCSGTALAEGHDSWLGVDARFVVDSSTANRVPFTAARRYSTGICTSVKNILRLHRKNDAYISL